jgi:acetyl-CoA C-acetyltransferase
MTHDLTPILIGVGEASERIDAADYQALSPVALAAKASQAAIADAGGAGLAAHIDLIAAIRQFEVSTPVAAPPFGASNNFPRSVASRIGADPARAVLEVTGGQGPQHLVNEMAHAIADGAVKMALLTGSEAISTVRHLQTSGETRDWSESLDGQLEDRGYGLEGLLTPEVANHGGRTAIQLYALFENARRGRLGLDRETYRGKMGELFAPFTRVAAGNPHAMSREVHDAAALATVTASNRLTSDPFPRRMVARDQANQGAAILLTSVGLARELGVPEDRWVYLYGGADVKERTAIERQDLSRSPASVEAVEAALSGAGVTLPELRHLDLYSCFPIAVFNITDALGLGVDDPRGLTVTGGLPFFGGAGNNYSMHAIAEIVRRLRATGGVGLIGANGGFLSKYSVGVYGTAARPFKAFDSKPLQARIDAWPAPVVAAPAAGQGTVTTYTIDYSAKDPRGMVIGQTPGGERFVAMTDKDSPLVQRLIDEEPIGATVTFSPDDKGRLLLTGFEPA